MIVERDPVPYKDYHRLEMALVMLVRTFEKVEKTKEQQKFFDGAKKVLEDQFNILDILR